ncbi:MAG: gamma-glutamyl-gamma-aminobutyrate hydrolase family protein [Gemmatimonadota bacterium]
MNDRSLVAVTSSLDLEAGRSKRPSVFLYTNYLIALERMGLAGVLLTPSHSPESVDALLARCSGLVLSGGEDVAPSRYGEKPHPNLEEVLPERDEMECRAIQTAFELELPVLAICRGIQILNVYLGGTLYQDLHDQYETPLDHSQSQPWETRTHVVHVEPASRLCKLVDCEDLTINSFHHQAIKDLAPGLRVVARAEDGIIEGVESTEHDWVVGVQWHPERHEARAEDVLDPDRNLFNGFRRAVAGYASGHVLSTS